MDLGDRVHLPAHSDPTDVYEALRLQPHCAGIQTKVVFGLVETKPEKASTKLEEACVCVCVCLCVCVCVRVCV